MTIAIAVAALIVSGLALWNAALARQELRDYDRMMGRGLRGVADAFRAGGERTRKRRA